MSDNLYNIEAIAKEIVDELVEEGYMAFEHVETAVSGVEEVLREHLDPDTASVRENWKIEA